MNIDPPEALGLGGKRPGAGRPKGSRDSSAVKRYAIARAEKEEQLARLRRMEADERATHLVAIEEVLEEWSSIVEIAKSRMLALPSRVAPELAVMTDARDIDDFLRAAVHEILTEFANGVRRNST